MREVSARNTRKIGQTSICFWLPAMAASSARTSGRSTATTDQVCRLDEVAADCAAATSASSVPSGSGSGLKLRTERCDSSSASVSFHGPALGSAPAP